MAVHFLIKPKCIFIPWVLKLSENESFIIHKDEMEKSKKILKICNMSRGGLNNRNEFPVLVESDNE